jgi:hypothetical protein
MNERRTTNEERERETTMADINPTTGNPLHYYLQMIPTNSRLKAAAAAASSPLPIARSRGPSSPVIGHR